MPKKRYNKEDILDACYPVFARNGYNKTSTSMLAEAAGISKALIFHHYENKKTLYLSIVKKYFEGMIAQKPSPEPEEYRDFFEAKEKMGVMKVGYFDKDPLLSKLMYEAFYKTPDELKTDIYLYQQELEEKYGAEKKHEEQMMSKLFHQIPFRKGIDKKMAFELINLLSEYFRKKLMEDLIDESKMTDTHYWESFLQNKKAFMEMVRFGIEEPKENDNE